jgi:hypothetical protein
MPIRPNEFLQAAREVYSKQQVRTAEPRARITGGRAYYAAYLEVREVLRQESGRPRLRVRHEPLSQTLKGHPDACVDEIGSLLDTLRLFREQCDYETADAVREFDAGLQLAAAETILNLLPNCRQRVYNAAVAAHLF